MTLTVLSGSVLFLILVLVIFTFRYYSLFFKIEDVENAYLNNVTSRSETYTLKEEKKLLTHLNHSVSDLLSNEVEDIVYDVRFLQAMLEKFLGKSYNYKERVLPNALYENVYSREPYVHYSQRLIRSGVTPEIEKEVRIVSNISDYASFLTKFYSCIFIGSQKGYTVADYVLPKNMKQVPVSTEPTRYSYDPVKRSWFETGKKLDSPQFTDIYLAQTGVMTVSCIVPYKINGEFEGVLGVDCDPNRIYSLVKSIADDENDLYFILSKKGEILFINFDSDDLKVTLGLDIRKSNDETLANVARKMVEGECGFEPVTIKGKDYFIAYSPVKNVGWSFASLIPKEKVYIPAKRVRTHLEKVQNDFFRNVDNFISWMGLSTLLLLLLILYIIFRMIIKISDSVAKPILTLTKGVNEFAAGNLDKRVTFESNDEIQNIADNFNLLAQRLQDTISDLSKVSAQKKRLDAEVDVVNMILMNYLPDNFRIAQNFNFDLYALDSPAKISGGDFYDFYMLDDVHMVICVGDVSGRGVPSALFMMIAKSVLKSFIKMNSEPDLSTVISKINERLYNLNSEKMYLAVFIGIVNLKTGKMTYVNAGHYAPYVYSAQNQSGDFLINESIDPIMALNPDIKFHPHELFLEKGDLIYLYTDGIIETSKRGEKFDETKLGEAVLNATLKGASSEEIIKSSLAEAAAFVDRTEFADDVVLLCLKHKG